MEFSEVTPLEDETTEKRLRGKGRGSNFFVLRRAVWEQLCSVPTVSRLNLITAYLVLLAGTGSDHRLTKWSAKACEEHAGLGKPRAKQAIGELISHGMVELTENSKKLSPQYQLPPVPLDEEPIFLPRQLITGLAGETPILRRIRETGDPLALEMLIDLYGMVQEDATFGIPIANFREGKLDEPGQKVCETGVHAIWAMPISSTRGGSGDWIVKHQVKVRKDEDPWGPFWDRVAILERTGALWFEPWAFDGPGPYAEPIMPVDPSVLYASRNEDGVSELTRLMQQAAMQLALGNEYLLERYPNDILIPLPLHHQAPAVRGVARLRVDADTPGCRRAYGSRMSVIERATAALQRLIADVTAERYDRPITLNRRQEAE